MRLIRVLLGVWLLGACLFGTASAGSYLGEIKLEPKTSDTVQAQITVQQPLNEQLLAWFWQNGGDHDWRRRISIPAEPERVGASTIYRFDLPISGGDWQYSFRLGSGQMGFSSYGGSVAYDEKLGAKRLLSFQNQFLDSVPALVQPVGYAVYGLIALLAVGLSALILRRLARRHETRTDSTLERLTQDHTLSG
jgi:hypothetical protein